MAFNEIEQEAIILNAIWDMIDQMVNFANFAKLDQNIHDTNLMWNNSETLRLFHVLLVDFLSPLRPASDGDKKGQLPFNLSKPPSKARSSDLTFLFYLRQVCTSPRLGDKFLPLSNVLEAFAMWLEEDSIVPDVWLPAIELQVSLTIERKTWIKICGDIGKHNFSRLEFNVNKITKILENHGHPIDKNMGYILLPNFWEWFHDDIFAYHASTIAEFLNNIRWAIFRYLIPEYTRAYRPFESSVRYEFDYPKDMNHALARSMYWDLMNRCRLRPYFPEFTVDRHLKIMY